MRIRIENEEKSFADKLFEKRDVIYMLIILVLTIVLIVKYMGAPPEFNCPDIPAIVCQDCPVCEECAACPAPTAEIVTQTKYYCEDGTEVTSKEECVANLNDFVAPEGAITTNNIIFSFDSFAIDEDGTNIGHVTNIKYTLANNGTEMIVPEIAVLVYSDDSDVTEKAKPKYTIKPQIVLKPGASYEGSQDVKIVYSGPNSKVKLVLQNVLPDPNVNIGNIEKDISLDAE